MRAWVQNNDIWQETDDLTRALKLQDLVKGSVAVIGAGGKTSTIHRLAEEAAARGLKVIITTTTRMYREPGPLAATAKEAEQLLRTQSIVFAGLPAEEGKICGLKDFDRLSAIADLILIEADGSKQLPLKVPADHEPVIPEATDRILLLAGLSGLRKRLHESCHRAALASQLLGKSSEQIIQEKDVAKLLTDGYLKKWKWDITKISVLINQADSMELLKAGEAIADLLVPYHCVIARLKDE
jgi:probable selenium-dependent hydroxylase accessory protein YqeC